jgi:hypothetical protein
MVREGRSFEPKVMGTSRRGLAVASIGILLAVTFVAGLTVGRDRRPEPVEVSPNGSRAEDHLRYRPETPRMPFTDALEPYDYDPAPPLEPTALDGYYLRIVGLDQVGGPRWGLPFHCRRCPAYRVDPGVETILLYRGRFWLEHQMSGTRAYGHYVVDRNRVTFFNDANCSHTRGVYRWSRTGSSLSLEVIRDPCPFEDERADDLTFSLWTRVRTCLSGIRYWWPALVGCQGGESGVRF